MVSAEIARNVVGIIGNIISLFLFLSPLPTFYHIWKKGSVEQYSLTPYLVTLVSCMAWVMYGLPFVHPKGILVTTINGAGATIELVYIIVFVIYCSDNKKRFKVLVIVLFELIFIGLLAYLVLSLAYNKREMVVGMVSNCFCVMMYASPLSVMKLVITTKSVEYMPIFLSLAGFANGVTWSCFALIHFDLFILVPNGVGALFCLVQLILYVVYYKSTDGQTEAKHGKVEGMRGLSELIVNGDSKNGYGLQNNKPSPSN